MALAPGGSAVIDIPVKGRIAATVFSQNEAARCCVTAEGIHAAGEAVIPDQCTGTVAIRIRLTIRKSRRDTLREFSCFDCDRY